MQIMSTCSHCHQDFNMAENMTEREVFASEQLVLTVLVCPHCKNEMVTQIDNPATLQIHEHNLLLLRKIGQRQYHFGKGTDTQLSKQEQLTKKLYKARNDLNNKYNHTSYQFDGEEHKLDIHIPSMKISEG